MLMISQSSSEQSICFIVPEDAAARTLTALESAFEYDMLRHNVERVWGQDDVAILSVVGERMKGTPGIAVARFPCSIAYPRRCLTSLHISLARRYTGGTLEDRLFGCPRKGTRPE